MAAIFTSNIIQTLLTCWVYNKLKLCIFQEPDQNYGYAGKILLWRLHLLSNRS
jgi:hypothetical protein